MVCSVVWRNNGSEQLKLDTLAKDLHFFEVGTDNVLKGNRMSPTQFLPFFHSSHTIFRFIDSVSVTSETGIYFLSFEFLTVLVDATVAKLKDKNNFYYVGKDSSSMHLFLRNS